MTTLSTQATVWQSIGANGRSSQLKLQGPKLETSAAVLDPGSQDLEHCKVSIMPQRSYEHKKEEQKCRLRIESYVRRFSHGVLCSKYVGIGP